jgi:hypothetical protein
MASKVRKVIQKVWGFHFFGMAFNKKLWLLNFGKGTTKIVVHSSFWESIKRNYHQPPNFND